MTDDMTSLNVFDPYWLISTIVCIRNVHIVSFKSLQQVYMPYYDLFSLSDARYYFHVLY